MMRTVILLIGLVIFFSSFAFSQQLTPKSKADSGLVGVWQIGSAEINDGLMANWRFFPDGKFKYGLRNGNMELLRSIDGTYYLDKEGLHTKIEGIEILRGFKAEGTDPGAEFGHFKLKGGKVVVVEQKDSNYSFHWFKEVTPKVYITIDGDNYYRVSGDPKKRL